MRGSGLSLERFIKGKAQRTKADAKSKKKVIIRKALRKREYEKVKKREGIVTQRGRNPVVAPTSGDGDDDDDASGPSSFYDRFFKGLQKGDVDSDNEDTGRARPATTSTSTGKDAAPERRAPTAKPDPFFKAKKKAEAAKLERQQAQAAKEKQRAVVEQKVSSRKKRHVKLSQRTASGQPVVKNHITDILSRLQAEKQKTQ